MTQLSKHFTVAEMERSMTATRLGINNTANEANKAHGIAVAVGILEPCRKHFGKPIRPSSWLRVPELDAAIRGPKIHARWLAGDWKPNSQHTTGGAVDFEIAGIANYDLACWIRDNCTFDQLILEFYEPGKPNSGWVHVSRVLDGNNRRACLTYDGKTYQPRLLQ